MRAAAQRQALGRQALENHSAVPHVRRSERPGHGPLRLFLIGLDCLATLHFLQAALFPGRFMIRYELEHYGEVQAGYSLVAVYLALALCGAVAAFFQWRLLRYRRVVQATIGAVPILFFLSAYLFPLLVDMRTLTATGP